MSIFGRYYIADADTNEFLFEITDNMVIDPTTLSGHANFTIVANPLVATAESVSFNYDAGQQTRTESVLPYALFGDNDGDLSGGLNLSEGSHSLATSYYTQDGAGGSLIGSETLDFSVAGPKTDAGTFWIADATSDQLLFEVKNGDTINRASLPSSYTIVGVSGVGGESMTLDLDGAIQRTESVAPYALLGDTNGDLSGGLSLSVGSHTLDAGVYSQDYAGGFHLAQESISFFVV
jgi:hypothetical protein